LGCGLQTPDGLAQRRRVPTTARLAKYPFIRRALAWFQSVAADRLSTPWSSSIFIHDIRKALPFPDSSVAAIYASHVLEHLYHEEAQRLVRESWRVLAAGGVLRVVVPDLEAIVREYMGERPFGPQTGQAERLCRADLLNQRAAHAIPIPGLSPFPPPRL